MPRVDPLQEEFTGGELSPRLLGRVSLKKYKAGLSICENFLIQPHGPANKRGGTRFVLEVKDSSKTTILQKFDYKNEFQYVFEFGHNYIRFFRNQANIENGGSPYEVVTTYGQTEVEDLRFEQDEDTLYIFHKDHAPAKLVRTAHNNWTLSNISFTSAPGAWGANNYPTLGFFFELRFFLAATPDESNWIWGSQSADYFNMGLGTGEDSEGIALQIKKATKFLWVTTEDVILLGAHNGEFKLASNTLNEALTPGNIRPSRATSYGSAFMPAIQIDSDTIFVQRGLRKIRKLQYRWQTSSYTATPITILSEHITISGLKEIAYSNEPDSYIWGIRTDGILIGMTYEPDDDVLSWHRHPIGGTDVVVKSIAVIDGATEAHKDEIWMIVSRTVDEDTVQYVEYLTPEGLTDDDDQEDSFFVECGVTATGSDLDEVTIAHLEGETVRILADGAVQPPQVVTDGVVSINPVSDKIHVGIGYDATIETLPIEGGNPIGTAQTKIKKIIKIALRLYRSLTFYYGPVGGTVSDGTLDVYAFGPPDEMGEAIPLFTGDTLEIPFPGGYDTQGKIKILSQDPLPLTVVAIAYELRTKD